LIELIRSGRTEEALGFAAEFLAPQGEENPAFLEELGKSLHYNMARGEGEALVCSIALAVHCACASKYVR